MKYVNYTISNLKSKEGVQFYSCMSLKLHFYKLIHDTIMVLCKPHGNHKGKICS
jgi:hypothetical protein